MAATEALERGREKVETLAAMDSAEWMIETTSW
jgi:hypothetical protein